MMTSRPTCFEGNQQLQHWTSEQIIECPHISKCHLHASMDFLIDSINNSANQPNRPLGKFRCTPFLGLVYYWPAKIPDLCQIEAVHETAATFPPFEIAMRALHVVIGKNISLPSASLIATFPPKVGHQEGR